MSKSYVSLEQHICPVCGSVFDTGVVLFDSRLRSKMDHHTITDYGLCPEHLRLFNEGHVALVECDPQRSGIEANINCIKPSEAYRTGNIAHLKREVYVKLFNTHLEAHEAIAFVDLGVIEQLQAIAN